MPHREGLPNAVIAVWGKIELEPLDPNEVATVASWGPARGLLVSFLGDLQRSARTGVPVYRLTGGPGFSVGRNFQRQWTRRFCGS